MSGNFAIVDFLFAAATQSTVLAREKVLATSSSCTLAVCLESEKLCACKIVANWQPKNGPTTQPRPRIQRRQALPSSSCRRRPSTGGHFEVSYKTNQRTRMKLNLYCCVCRSTRINFSSSKSAHIKTTDSGATAPEPQSHSHSQSHSCSWAGK